MSEKCKKDNKQLQSISAARFPWEKKFDLKLLENYGITVITEEKLVFCNYCECILPQLSYSNDASIYNIKVHVICKIHKLNCLMHLMKIQLELRIHRQEVAEVTRQSKDTKMFNVLTNGLTKEKNIKLILDNVDQVFKTFEKKLKDIHQVQQIGFNKFKLHRNSILFTNRKEGHCIICKKTFPSIKDVNYCYRNLMIHICGRKHCDRLKNALPDKESELEYKVLKWLNKHIIRKGITFD